MSVNKLLSRIVAPHVEDMAQPKGKSQYAAVLHDHTYGITSDPLTQFAVVFSALVHDIDHRGVSNAQLAQEERALANTYRNKSIAEQNSVDIAMKLLQQEEYSKLRACIYANDDEKNRFRQIVVNSVMATDIFDKELTSLRKSRWNKAFAPSSNESAILARNRKATIVIEHLIQASDVSHTMQHWHIYRKWNERLFRESCIAWTQGRATLNPAAGWYEGEIWFFGKSVKLHLLLQIMVVHLTLSFHR